jgi:hypothetical protein
MNELTHQFRGDILRSVQAGGLALVDQHTQRGNILPRHRHVNAWFTFLFAGSYVERLSSLERCCSAGMVIWHPADLVHANNFVSNGHNLNLHLRGVIPFAIGLKVWLAGATLPDSLDARNEASSGQYCYQRIGEGNS